MKSALGGDVHEDAQLAHVLFAPDGCGMGGSCTDEMWTDVEASAAVLTTQGIAIAKAVRAAPDDAGDIGERIAKDFNITEQEVWREYAAAAFPTMEEVVLSGDARRFGALSDAEEEQACRWDLQCWGDKNSLAATIACQGKIERLSRYGHEWTDSWLGAKFGRFQWVSRDEGVIRYQGDQIRFQNGFGAWIPHTYWCHYDTMNKTVLDL